MIKDNIENNEDIMNFLKGELQKVNGFLSSDVCKCLIYARKYYEDNDKKYWNKCLELFTKLSNKDKNLFIKLFLDYIKTKKENKEQIDESIKVKSKNMKGND